MCIADESTLDSHPINWQSVAKQIPGRTNKDCRKRWVYSLAPSIRKGTWDNKEDALLQEGVERHGTRSVKGQYMAVSLYADCVGRVGSKRQSLMK